MIKIRKARPADRFEICELTKKYRGTLPRKPREILGMISNFFVAISGNGNIVGCCGFRVFKNGDAEIISLVVEEKFRGKKMGALLAAKCLNEALNRPGVKRIMTLTTRKVSRIFKRLNFKKVEIQLFCEKILVDCRRCPRNIVNKRGKHQCNEIAMLHVK